MRSAGAESARDAGLVYAPDDSPGVSRRRQGAGFRYVRGDGRPLSAADRARIRSLVIPPAWSDVWIAADPRAHVQATGRDARGRKQYRYHPEWSRVRDSAKFDRLIAFARGLSALRRRVRADLRKAPLSREWVLATVIALLERTLIRVGNDEYARQNGSYGLTTLQDRHALVTRGRIIFRFRAKSGIEQRIDLDDAALARRVKRCQDLPGQTLFQYLDADGQPHAIGSGDVNAYLRDVMGETFTAKDFRTWAGTVLAARTLAGLTGSTSEPARRRDIVQAVDQVAHKLGNTRTVCRKCYIHPAVLEAYLHGVTIHTSGGGAGPGSAARGGAVALSPAERAVVALLKSSRRARHWPTAA
jgi:DNA topoisomerase-1